MVDKIQLHIKSLNFGYKKSMGNIGVTYKNSLAEMLDKNTIQLTDKKGKKETVKAKFVLIAVGSRPTYPDIENVRELSFTSDDLFQLPARPQKVCIVGASFVALECGGFLRAMGSEVTILVRSILLRGFDQHMSEMVGAYMEKLGIKFLRKAIPKAIRKMENGQKEVEYDHDGKTVVECFDGVMFAIGRTADTALGLDKIGVKLAGNKKILVKEDDSTSVPNIFAIGDCSEGRPELTPPAIMAGGLLAERLFNKSTRLMDYINIPITVFTPIEYGSCGWTEEAAIEKFTEENILCYVSKMKPLEWNYNEARESDCYCKLVVHKPDQKVLGFHYIGPHAGEITQGYAVAIKMGATMEHFRSTVGIHPTVAEEFVILKKVKGIDDEEKTGC